MVKGYVGIGFALTSLHIGERLPVGIEHRRVSPAGSKVAGSSRK
jgi:hypothetical protein